MEKQQMIKGFNGWMDEFIKNPSGFKKTQETIDLHLKERNGGKAPTYGERCEAALVNYATAE